MVVILTAALLAATPDGPLAADPVAADRGTVRTGPPLVQTFTLTHRGAAGTVHILGAEASCGCLAPTVSRTELVPGERATVTLVINTLTQPEGPNVWRTTVRYRLNDGPESSVELRAAATLVADVTVTPPALAISTAGTATQTITVTDRRATPLTVRTAATSSPHLNATMRPPATSNGVRTQAIDLAVAATFPEGRADDTLVLVTDDPECPELRVPVKVVKRSPTAVAASPAVLDVRLTSDRPETSRLVQVRSPGGGVVRIDRVESSHPQLRVKWSEAAGPVATVRLTVAAGDVTGTAEARVVLAEPAGQVVVVPVGWSVDRQPAAP